MTCRRMWAGSRRAAGVSLIELMISITIGLIIISAVFSAYLGVAGASRVAVAQSRMDEDAQAALTILTQQLRLAGVNPAQNWTSTLNYSTDTDIYNPMYLPAPVYKDPPYAAAYAGYKTPAYTSAQGMPPFALSGYTFRGCEGSFENVLTADSLDDLICDTDTTKPNSFGVNYEADIYSTVPASTDPSAGPTDCLGIALNQITAKIPQQLPAAASSGAAPASTAATPPPTYTSTADYNDAHYYEADNRFYVFQPTTAPQTPSLYCKGNGVESVAQPLIENVEDMQINYGVQAPAGVSLTVAGYLRADELLAQADLSAQALTEAGRWKKVITVRICLQMRSAAPVVSSLASARYLKCDGTLETKPPDLRLRRTYTTTVVLRNKLL